MIFDVKKVTYNTYSCAISGMHREMMKMDSRDRVECQNWEKKDINVMLEIVLSGKRQKCNSDCLLQLNQRPKTWGEEKSNAVAIFVALEREDQGSL